MKDFQLRHVSSLGVEPSPVRQLVSKVTRPSWLLHYKCFVRNVRKFTVPKCSSSISRRAIDQDLLGIGAVEINLRHLQPPSKRRLATRRQRRRYLRAGARTRDGGNIRNQVQALAFWASMGFKPDDFMTIRSVLRGFAAF